MGKEQLCKIRHFKLTVLTVPSAQNLKVKIFFKVRQLLNMCDI